MSGAETPDGSTDAASSTDQTAEPVATIHLEGPATFERSLGNDHAVTATHEDVTIEGTVTVDQDTLFEMAPPDSALSKEFILKQILGHESLRSGYTASDPAAWNVEFQASVEDWRALTADVADERPYSNNDPPEAAMRYLASLANEGILGDSGLMAILELSQEPDVSLSDQKRADILDALHPDSEETSVS